MNIKERQRENMKLSVETKVAAAIAAGFIALTAGVIAQSQSSGQPPNEYAPSTNPSVNTHMGQRGYNNSPNAGDAGQRFADETASANRQKKTTKQKAGMSSKHRKHRTQQDQGTQTTGPGF